MNTTQATAHQVHDIAVNAVDVANGSAMICLHDAGYCYRERLYDDSVRKSLKSLAHSVGVFHPAYKQAAALAPALDLWARKGATQ